MSQFSRRARWLRQLFTQSVSPAQSDPSVVSDDVSLVQTYDGGGVGISEPTFPPERDGDTLTDALLIDQPEVAIRDYVSRIGITTISDMYLMSPDVYARILMISTQLIAGTTPTQQFFDMRPPSGSGVSEHITLISANYAVVPAGVRIPYPLFNDLILPGMQLNWNQLTGAAATQVRITIAWIVAPVGAVILPIGRSSDQRSTN